jgi:hypothetical protein
MSMVSGDHSRVAYNDPTDVVFDVALEIRMGFVHAYARYEHDVIMATRRKAQLARDRKKKDKKSSNKS